MRKEEKLANFIHTAGYEDIPVDVREGVKRQCVAIFGAAVAGWEAAGIPELAGLTKELGGKAEATTLIYGDKVPAHAAAFVNSSMARAWDICDHISPGPHIGAATIPAALAAAELTGGCSGKDFITAVAVGTEIGLRLNLREDEYAGFDPTGIVAIMGATAAACWLMKLSEEEIINAMALAFNKCGGSFQSHADGALAVRVIEGWCAESGIECARFAKLGITGPENWLDGHYGFFFLYGRGRADTEKAVRGLGKEWNVTRLNFKKYPSCGVTQGSTQLALDMQEEFGFTGADVERATVLIPPFTYKLVGEFKLGANPKVDAQFSVGYCVANALYRPPVQLTHFEPEAIRDPGLLRFLEEHVVVEIDEEIARTREHYSSDLEVRLKDGRVFKSCIDVPPGTPAYPMTEEEHRQRFYDCVAFGALPWIDERADEIHAGLKGLEEIEDVLTLFELLCP